MKPNPCVHAGPWEVERHPVELLYKIAHTGALEMSKRPCETLRDEQMLQVANRHKMDHMDLSHPFPTKLLQEKSSLCCQFSHG